MNPGQFESLEFKGVRHAFRTKTEPVPTLGGLDLTVGRNQFITVVGPSAAGNPRFSTLPQG